LGNWISKLKDRLVIAGRREIQARAPRVQLLSLHKIKFEGRSGTPLAGQSFGVSNISVSGLGLMLSEAQQSALSGQPPQGTLSIGDERFEVELEVKHASTSVAGCRFKDASGAIVAAIQTYLELELSALELRPVDSELLQRTAKGEPLWFFRDRSCELYVVVEQDSVLHFHGSFCGFYFEGGDGKSARFGYLTASPESKTKKHPQSDIIRFESNVTDAQRALIQRFVQYVPGLQKPVGEQIQKMVVKSA
jgi:hypothetical protein